MDLQLVVFPQEGILSFPDGEALLEEAMSLPASDDEQSRFVETVATLALEARLGGNVTASHTTAMHSYNGAYTARLFRLL